MIKLEVCANSVQSAIEAQRGGASRIELCNNLYEGGTTPSISQIEYVINNIRIETNVLIRPRGGDFVYSDMEFEIMKQDIHHCGRIGCSGIVVGILKADGSIDKIRNKELIDIAKQKYNMTVTFHRAIDNSKDLFTALGDIIDLGCDKVLTSGGEKEVIEGKEVIRNMVNLAKERIIIMPGGGVTENNIRQLVKETGIKEAHGSFQKEIQKIIDKEDSATKNSYFETDHLRVRTALKNANMI